MKTSTDNLHKRKKTSGNLYISKLEIVDDTGQGVYKVKDKGVQTAMIGALEVVEEKDGPGAILKILKRFSKDLDDKFKEMFGIGDDEDEKQRKDL